MVNSCLRYIVALMMLASTLEVGTMVRAQGSGDQILDGIGETALIARYVLDGDLQDWSRNNLHARAYADGVAFVEAV